MPSADTDVLNLRPIAAGEAESCIVYLPIEGKDVKAAHFPLPGPGDIGDHQGVRLLASAARLLIRYGAGPFRSFGQLGFRPRPYQLVPMLMALRLDPVRMMIADDVGVGKTIEAALIARELLDRGEVKRIGVVCPPYLCDQWKRELAEKFNIDAVVIRAESLAHLEREKPRPEVSVFQYYPHIIVSVDFAKSERLRYRFLEGCPDLVIVDEAHGAAKPGSTFAAQQQRHELVSEIAKKTDRHLILVTATPHSGIAESFLSLVGLIKSEFATLDLDRADKSGQQELARHFVQRRRRDIERWLGDTRFPRRDAIEEPYELTPSYLTLFNDVYSFAGELVRTGEAASPHRQRVRYWAALALLRSVMSSPASALAAFQSRRKREFGDEETDEGVFASGVTDSTEGESVVDVVPTHAVDTGEATFSESEKRRLREFERRAEGLKGEADAKVRKAEAVVTGLLKDGFQPIVFCRFIDTAEYVAKQLQERLSKSFPDIRVMPVTGNDPEDDRKAKVAELQDAPRRVLVATDCLSEGVNLQEGFNAVIHYDLPWNPNRLDQREGRVDRFGQTAAVVKAILLYGSNNIIDGKVLEVLVRKAREIHSRLGVMVPLPVDSDTVMASVLKALFWEKGGQQLRLFEVDEVVKAHGEWKKAEERQERVRSIFAQQSIKPDEVAKELGLADAVMGDPAAVKDFIMNACQRLGSPVTPRKSGWQLDLGLLPKVVNLRITAKSPIRLVFDQPVPEGATVVTRNHQLTEALSEHLFDGAFDPADKHDVVCRAGVVLTKDVATLTTVFILRLRFSLRDAGTGALSMAEECLLTGFCGAPDTGVWFDSSEAERLLREVKAAGNLAPEVKSSHLCGLLAALDKCQPRFETLAKERAKDLQESYERLRKTVKGNRTAVTPLSPVDVLSIVILVPA